MMGKLFPLFCPQLFCKPHPCSVGSVKPSRRDHSAIEPLRQIYCVGFYEGERRGIGANGNPIYRTDIGCGLNDVIGTDRACE